uniref:GST N-terminal domain-containing protein n=1 Tax=Anguilla anguilla TaxID=7936 RepID=A0A0E9P7F4_ANGAN
MRDEEFILAESIAILKYLAEKFRTPDHWYPADLQKRARVNEVPVLAAHSNKDPWFKGLLVPGHGSHHNGG